MVSLTYYLDPDFRRNAPKDHPFCCRCQKRIKGDAIRVTVNWETWEVTKDRNGTELIGADCWKIISKQNKENI